MRRHGARRVPRGNYISSSSSSSSHTHHDTHTHTPPHLASSSCIKETAISLPGGAQKSEHAAVIRSQKRSEKQAMAMEAEAVVRRPFQHDGEVAGGLAPAFLATERDRPVDPVIWGDEKRMKRELVAWAKAVASMAAANKQSTSSTPSSARRRGRP